MIHSYLKAENQTNLNCQKSSRFFRGIFLLFLKQLADFYLTVKKSHMNIYFNFLHIKILRVRRFSTTYNTYIFYLKNCLVGSPEAAPPHKIDSLHNADPHFSKLKKSKKFPRISAFKRTIYHPRVLNKLPKYNPKMSTTTKHLKVQTQK
jgi:hypothetical protein